MTSPETAPRDAAPRTVVSREMMQRSVTQLEVWPAEGPLRGRIRLPDDVAILLPRVALAASARGQTSFRLLREPHGSLSTLLRALELLGIDSEHGADAAGFWLSVRGVGIAAELAQPGVLDLVGDSHVGALLVGLLAGRPGTYELLVDRVVADELGPAFDPSWGLEFEPRGELAIARLRTEREQRGAGLSRAGTGLFAWSKQALLLAALRAQSPTEFVEQHASADHLERAMTRLRAPLDCVGSSILLHPPRDADALGPTSYEPIGSARALGYLAALALSLSGSQITLLGVSSNPTGESLAPLLSLLGAPVEVLARGDREGEPVADVTLRGPLGPSERGRARALGGETLWRVGDAVAPLLLALGRGEGLSEVSDWVPRGRGGDPRFLARALGFLRSAGIEVEISPEGLRIGTGAMPRPVHLRALTVTTGGDGRLAALGTLLGLLGDGPSIIDDVECLRDEFPRFVGTLRALGARLEVKGT